MKAMAVFWKKQHMGSIGKMFAAKPDEVMS